MADEPLIRDRELASPAFVRDLRLFLTQTAEVMAAISETGSGPDGFAGRLQSQELSSQFGLSVNRARACLRVAEYLYSRCSELGFEADEAVTQIATVAAGLDEPIDLDEYRRNAVASILSFKREFEVARAIATAISDAPHFINVNGTWAVKVVRISDGEIIKVPVIGLSIAWHDGLGNNHEAFLQMSEGNWADFKEKIETLSSNRRELDTLL